MNDDNLVIALLLCYFERLSLAEGCDTSLVYALLVKKPGVTGYPDIKYGFGCCTVSVTKLRKWCGG